MEARGGEGAKQGLPSTIQGEWFPNETVAFPVNGCQRGDETPLETEMRLFGSATRSCLYRAVKAVRLPRTQLGSVFRSLACPQVVEEGDRGRAAVAH